MNVETLFILAPLGSILALVFAFYFFRFMKRQDPGTADMQRIAGYVQKGAMVYLKQQYKVVTFVFLLIFLLFSFMAYVLHAQNPWVPFAFVTGGFFSGLAGFLGMRTATWASNRTTAGARNSLNRGLQIAFRSGAVMGLVVVGLALLDISLWFLILRYFIPAGPSQLAVITTTMLTFGMGASTQALFARVGGGIFTKSADVGADLVGKLEAGIPEDDPRNPATIADNVGDNVGDVAGMGADLYESYAGSILATSALGVAAGYGLGGVLAPMVIAGIGVIFSILGVFLVRSGESASQKVLLKALARGINASTLLTLAASYFILVLFKDSFQGRHVGIFLAVIAGLIAGWLIGKITEYYTSQEYKPTQYVASQSQTGPATVIIAGISTGMQSTGLPVLVIAAAIIISFALSGGFSSAANAVNLGLYGISFASVGMLSTLGITLATDAYGPIADNAGGNAEMTHQDPEVRRRTDALDALGNTTAATGKGFAIGSAALTAMALLAAYIEEVKIGFLHMGQKVIAISGVEKAIENTHIGDWVSYYDLTILNPRVPGRALHRRHDGLRVLRHDHEVGRPRRRQDGRGSAPPVPRDRRHHGGHVRARLRPLRRDQHPRRPARDGGAGADRHLRPGGHGAAVRRGRRHRPAGGRPDHRLRGRRFPEQLRRQLGQRQEVHRGGEPGRQEASRRQPQPQPRRRRHRRHRRRPLQGHVGPLAEHPDQADVDGLGGVRRADRQVRRPAAAAHRPFRPLK